MAEPFRPHDRESSWEFALVVAAAFALVVVALGRATLLRWCADCARARATRRERRAEEEALRLTRALLPTHDDESYGSSSNATVIELAVDGGTPTSAPPGTDASAAAVPHSVRSNGA
jgi:hypothetical protein